MGTHNASRRADATVTAPGTAPATTVAAVTVPATTAAPPTTVAPTTTVRGPRGSGQPVTLAFGGDVHFEAHLRDLLLADPQAALAPIAPVLSAADVAMVNLETAITERGQRVDKAFTFRAPAVAFDALAAAGVDVVTLANNHGMDFGVEGLLDTLDAAAAAGMPLVGAGRTRAEARAPWITEVNGQRIAVLGSSQVLDSALEYAWTARDDAPGLSNAYDVEALAADVRALRADVDTVVVYLHWGREREECPTERQLVTARALVDAGADVVVGAHTHRLLGVGRMDGAVVAYGLGNFVWYRETQESGRSGVLEVTVTGREVDGYRWVPARIRGGVPRLLEGTDTEAALADMERRRGCTRLAP